MEGNDPNSSSYTSQIDFQYSEKESNKYIVNINLGTAYTSFCAFAYAESHLRSSQTSGPRGRAPLCRAQSSGRALRWTRRPPWGPWAAAEGFWLRFLWAQPGQSSGNHMVSLCFTHLDGTCSTMRCDWPSPNGSVHNLLQCFWFLLKIMFLFVSAALTLGLLGLTALRAPCAVFRKASSGDVSCDFLETS